MLRTPVGGAFKWFGEAFNRFIILAEEGGAFVFGDLGRSANGVVFAFQVLPLIILVASLSAILYSLRSDAADRRRAGCAYAARDARQRSGVPDRGCEPVSRPRRCTLGDSSVPQHIDPVRADDSHDQRDGDGRRGHLGGVRAARRSASGEPVDGARHDRANLHHDGQDLRARDGRPGDLGPSAPAGLPRPTET